LIGDAAGPFPPIGQGVNAAMEAAMVLSASIMAAGDLSTGAASYDLQWKTGVGCGVVDQGEDAV
jgi:kynurenine 3-monooxygenase